jgi:hypothetical protein
VLLYSINLGFLLKKKNSFSHPYEDNYYFLPYLYFEQVCIPCYIWGELSAAVISVPVCPSVRQSIEIYRSKFPP